MTLSGEASAVRGQNAPKRWGASFISIGRPQRWERERDAPV